MRETKIKTTEGGQSEIGDKEKRKGCAYGGGAEDDGGARADDKK